MNTYRQRLAAASCFLFGLVVIANTHSAADGEWYWYAWLLQQGKRLYADMHLPLQPLFVLETEFFLALFGKGWLVSRIAAVLHLLAFCFGILLLARHSAWKDHQKAIVIACVFFVSIHFEAYRFDDYHVLADCFVLYSLLLLVLMLEKGSGIQRNVYLAAGLGILSGLSLITRLNDGAALIAGVAVVILCVVPGRKQASIAAYSVAAALTVVVFVLLSGDSLHDYALNSIFKAAGAKGGAANVLTFPFLLPANAARFLIAEWWPLRLFFDVLVVALSSVFLLRPFSRANLSCSAAKATLGILTLGIALWLEFPRIVRGDLIVALSAIWVLVAYGLGLAAVVRLFRSGFMHGQADGWDPREILLLVPLGMLASGSMSTGGHHFGLYAPVGTLILLLPIASPISLHQEWRRSAFLAVAALMALSGLSYRSLNPHSWLSYRCPPVFLDRQVFNHPNYGPMIIDNQLLHFIEPVCERIKRGPRQPELLSLPFPYANYFCAIPPWHGYVQTFFDTSTEDTISSLMEELQTAPPMWVLYQRQVDNLSLHEKVFKGGRRLPHRDLDELIMRKIDQGAWLVADRSQYLEGNDWILLRTRQ